jgi:sulfoxide reductase heme-binding subunit YedZ
VRASRLVKPLIFVLCLVPMGLLARAFFLDQLGANPIEKVELQTGRWTLRMLAITLSVTPLRRITGWNSLVRYRRMLGLFTYFYACTHLLVYIGLDMVFDASDIVEDVLEHLYVTVGMLTFLILTPLAITSTKGWVRRLGKRWVKLHRLIYVAAITGTIHYLWAVKKDTFLPLVYLAIFIVLLGFRLWDYFLKRSGASQTPAQSSKQIRATELPPA